MECHHTRSYRNYTTAYLHRRGYGPPVTILTGFLGALIGQKRLYLISLALFVAGSALCGTARSLETLTLFSYPTVEALAEFSMRSAAELCNPSAR